MAGVPDKNNSPQEKFLGFLYPEIKDLAKHFLTLISGVLVFSVTFSEYLLKVSQPPPVSTRALIAAWLAWIAAVICAGLGVLINFVAAVQALRRDERDIRGLVWVTYVAIDAGGILFVAGLLVLALSGVSKLL
jgi:hypothetical protein